MYYYAVIHEEKDSIILEKKRNTWNYNCKGEWWDMIRIQDIADKAGCSRTTVSNIIHGKTKRVSQDTIHKIKKIMEELNYTPNLNILEDEQTIIKNIGVVIYEEIHGRSSMQDAYVGELLATIEKTLRIRKYNMVVLNSNMCEDIIHSASAWNMDGLIILGYTEDDYNKLKKKVNKKIVLIDTYPDNEYTFYNVGINDYDGGYQVGKYLYEQGYKHALFLAEMTRGSDMYRWNGFKDAMETYGDACDIDRFIVIEKDARLREKQYEKLINLFLESKALAFSSDFNAVEAISILKNLGYSVPEDISIVGFDDNIYASLIYPKLTTVKQNVEEKGKRAVKLLFELLDGKEFKEKNYRTNVSLIERGTVRVVQNK